MTRRSIFLAVALLASLAIPSPVAAACHSIPVSWYSPTGIAGCELSGPTDGKASTWNGTVAAAQWCVYPWKDCQAVAVQSHRTGVTIIVTPAQFCDCWWLSDRRLIDLTRSQVLALGLDPADGLFEVTVTPVGSEGLPAFPDTAAKP